MLGWLSLHLNEALGISESLQKFALCFPHPPPTSSCFSGCFICWHQKSLSQALLNTSSRQEQGGKRRNSVQTSKSSTYLRSIFYILFIFLNYVFLVLILYGQMIFVLARFSVFCFSLKWCAHKSWFQLETIGSVKVLSLLFISFCAAVIRWLGHVIWFTLK